MNHPGLSSQYLLLSQPLRTNPILDSANFRGHRLTYLEKIPQNKMDPQDQQGDKIQIPKIQIFQIRRHAWVLGFLAGGGRKGENLTRTEPGSSIRTPRQRQARLC